jgi:hypothetical protein
MIKNDCSVCLLHKELEGQYRKLTGLVLDSAQRALKFSENFQITLKTCALAMPPTQFDVDLRSAVRFLDSGLLLVGLLQELDRLFFFGIWQWTSSQLHYNNLKIKLPFS